MPHSVPKSLNLEWDAGATPPTCMWSLRMSDGTIHSSGHSARHWPWAAVRIDEKGVCRVTFHSSATAARGRTPTDAVIRPVAIHRFYESSVAIDLEHEQEAPLDA